MDDDVLACSRARVRVSNRVSSEKFARRDVLNSRINNRCTRKLSTVYASLFLQACQAAIAGAARVERSLLSTQPKKKEIMPVTSSRLPGFFKKSVDERRTTVCDLAGLNDEERGAVAAAGELSDEARRSHY